jgi:hypothetical protein
VEMAKKHPTLSVPDAMYLGGFTRKQIDVDAAEHGRNLHQQVYKRLGKRQDIARAQLGLLKAASVLVSLTSPDSLGARVNPTAFSTPPPKGKKPTRRSSAQISKENAAAATVKRKRKNAHKRATNLYAKEMEKTERARTDKKLKRGKSAVEVQRVVEQEFGKGMAPSARTIQEHVAKGSIGESPVRRGHPGHIEESTFLILCNAFESYLRICQLNGKVNERKVLSAKIKLVMEKDKKSLSQQLLERVLRECAIDLLAGKVNAVEQRRIMWTSYKNLRMWFNNWFKDIEDLGFARRDNAGNLVIPEEQLSRILNVDETCLSVDGSKGNRGGRPAVTFFDARLPQIGRGASKSANTTTMITGSTAAGEAIPPHFQFQTKAKTEDTQRVRMDMFQYMPKIVGKFGCSEIREWSVTVGLNEKGGMSDPEFFEYFRTNIVPLYPDAKDEPGKRVMVKVDSGPGRLCMKLLTFARNLGFLIYPGVPNTTAVSQETDRNYGPFKLHFRTELDALMTARIDQDLSTNMPPWMIGLLVFGKNMDPTSKYYVQTSPFELGFSKEQNLRSWAAVGAAPPTAACLEDKKVRREIGDADDDINAFMLEVQQANDLAVKFLNDLGYRGELLQATIKKAKMTETLTVANTFERQEKLAKASTHGARFLATHGDHVTADDAFKASEIVLRRNEIARLEGDKATRIGLAEAHDKGVEVMNLGKPVNELKVTDLDKVLDMHQVDKKARGKRDQKRVAVAELWSKAPPLFDSWTDGDEAGLKELKQMKIELKDTALGRYQTQEKQRVRAAVGNMDYDERGLLLEHLVDLEEVRLAAEMDGEEEKQEDVDQAGI